MDKVDKLFYINLARRPDRNAHFLAECSKANIPSEKIERVEAVDGSSLPDDFQYKELFQNADYRNAHYAKNIFGNQLSHFRILQEMVERNYNYIIICQDDVIFREGFTEHLTHVMDSIPSNAEIVNIGMHKYAFLAHFEAYDFNNTDLLGVEVNPHICALNSSVNPCSLAYIVTLQGAKNMIEYCKTTGFLRATDHNYNGYLISKNIFYGSIPVLCTGNPSLGSDIFLVSDMF